MRVLLPLVWAGFLALAQTSSPPQDPAPLYASSSVVNAASPMMSELAPGTLATIYGAHLAFATRAVTPEDVESGDLPTVLPGTGVRVVIGNTAAPLLYVSPNQINFLISPDMGSGPVDLTVTLQTRSGPTVRLKLADASPALFQADPEFAAAVWQDGVVTVYATGLGRTQPPLPHGQLAKGPARLERLAEFRVEIAGSELPADAILYAGAAPGFAGLYQINFRPPAILTQDPEIRISLGAVKSPAGVRLRTLR